MPSAHVRLALKTSARLILVCCVLSAETQRYILHIEPPLEMIRTGNRDEEVAVNMRRVLDQLEGVIRRWLGQWQMFVPVWPELI
jgi:lauroyl/myristoyl acyltransferase